MGSGMLMNYAFHHNVVTFVKQRIVILNKKLTLLVGSKLILMFVSNTPLLGDSDDNVNEKAII
jgi:hypothetical protein